MALSLMSLGTVTKVIRNWSRTWPSWVYDLEVGQGNTCVLKSRDSRSDWLKLAGKYPHVYKWMGAVRPGLTPERIEADAEMQLADMGQYKTYSNNCYVFTDKMYEVERLL